MGIKKVLYLVAMWLLTLPIAFAQSTTVSGTIVDPDSIVWTHAQITAQFAQAPNTPGPYTWSGGAYNPQPTPIFTDGSGAFAISLPSNNAIAPAGSGWEFRVCPNATQQCAVVTAQLTGGTFNLEALLNSAAAWPTQNIAATFITKAYDPDQTGAIPLNQGAILFNTTTLVPMYWNGSIWQNFGTGGGGGGNPVGPGTIQSANADATAFFSAGILNTDTENTSNNGATQTQALLCTAAVCNMMTPPSSTDTANGGPLAKQGTKRSSYYEDLRGNRVNTYAMNPKLTHSIFGDGSQEFYVGFYGYTEPSQIFDAGTGLGGHQGEPQGFEAKTINFTTPGYSNGQQGCPLFCAAAGYLTNDVSDWTNSFVTGDIYNYYTSGIKEMNGLQLHFFATGDSDANAIFVLYAGGADAPSDEGEHAFAEVHNWTPGDFTCTVSTVIDGNHSFCTPATNSGTQGGGRYLIKTSSAVIGTDTNPLFQIPIDIIHLPGDGHPYGTVVSSTAHFPVSYAIGLMTNNCTVPTQQGTVASSSCDVTVSSGTFDTAGIACTWIQQAKLFNCGQVTAVAAAGAGHQLVTMTMNRSVPAGAFVFQGGMAGAAIDLTGDDVFGASQNGSLVRGSVFPLMGSLDAHTAIYVAFDASQVASGIPRAGSQSGSRALVGTPSSGINGRGFTAINLVRTANVVTATITTGRQTIPPIYQILNRADFINISGCADATMNSTGIPTPAHIIAENPLPVLQYTMPGSNADSTCATATIAMQNTVATYYWAAETLDVMNHADGIPPANLVDGTFTYSYQPNFTPGDGLDMPPHYAMNSDMINLQQELGQPGNSGGITVGLFNNSAINGDVLFTFSQYNDVLYWGRGGMGFPANFLHSRGDYAAGLVMEDAPIGGGSLLAAGVPQCNPSICIVPSQQLYNIFTVGAWSGNMQLTFQPLTNIATLQGNGGIQIAGWGVGYSTWDSSLSLANPIFREWDHTANSTEDATEINYCSVIQPDATTPPCYSHTVLPAPTVTAITTGSTQYIYIILARDASGNPLGWSHFTGIGDGNATPDNTIACDVLPAGTTGDVYIFVNPIMKLVGSAGACTSPAAVVTDNGTYGANQGHNPSTDFVPFYAGDFAAAGQGFIGFRQRDFFGTSTSAFTITAQITQPVDGTFSFDTTTRGDSAAVVKAGEVIVSGPTAAISTGVAVSDMAGELTLSGGSGTYTFVGTMSGGVIVPWTLRPECAIHDHTTPSNSATFAVTNTTLTITGTGTDVIGWACTFRQ